MAYDHFLSLCLNLGGTNFTWLWHSIPHKLLFLECSIFIVFLQMCREVTWQAIPVHLLPGTFELHMHHLKHL